MKVKVLRSFQDLNENVYRNAGDVFDVDKERFEQINKLLDGYIEPIEQVEERKIMARKQK